MINENIVDNGKAYSGQQIAEWCKVNQDESLDKSILQTLSANKYYRLYSSMTLFGNSRIDAYEVSMFS